jgi:hypothetical protein
MEQIKQMWKSLTKRGKIVVGFISAIIAIIIWNLIF